MIYIDVIYEEIDIINFTCMLGGDDLWLAQISLYCFEDDDDDDDDDGEKQNQCKCYDAFLPTLIQLTGPFIMTC